MHMHGLMRQQRGLLKAPPTHKTLLQPDQQVLLTGCSGERQCWCLVVGPQGPCRAAFVGQERMLPDRPLPESDSWLLLDLHTKGKLNLYLAFPIWQCRAAAGQ